MGNLSIPQRQWLNELFSDTPCTDCGRGARHHEAIFLDGNWFASCSGSWHTEDETEFERRLEVFRAGTDDFTDEELAQSSHYPMCVHCGYCCREAQCALSFRLYGTIQGLPHCPALYQDGSNWLCKHAKDYADVLYIGEGCCSPMNSDRSAKINKDTKEAAT